MKKKVLAAMSGGVDSSAAAMLLLQQGYEVIGVTARMFNGCDIDLPDAPLNIERDIKDAQAVAQKLGIEHKVVDLRACFNRHVIQHFASEYRCGSTPNPCVDCNKYIKFGALLDYARELGCDYLATGHYARIVYDNAKSRWLLARGEDHRKDQSYMLFSLSQEQLSHVLLPLGGVSKDEIRRLAAEAGLVTAQKPDSQDICFVPDGDYAGLIGRIGKASDTAGNFVHLNGQVLGRHKGLVNYTIGQRKGLGIAYGQPVFVRRILPNGDIQLATAGGEEYAGITVAQPFSASGTPFAAGQRFCCKVRSRAAAVPCTVVQAGGPLLTLRFDSPVRAPAPGQAAVFYDGDVVLGGGIIGDMLAQV